MRKRIWRKHDERSRYEISLNWLDGWTRIHPYVGRWKRGLTRVSSSSSSVSKNFQKFLDDDRPPNAFKFSSTKLEVGILQRQLLFIVLFILEEKYLNELQWRWKEIFWRLFPSLEYRNSATYFFAQFKWNFQFQRIRTSNDSSDKNSKIIIDEKRNEKCIGDVEENIPNIFVDYYC